MAEHRVTEIEAGNGRVWIECSCGWGAGPLDSVPAARRAWALHKRQGWTE